MANFLFAFPIGILMIILLVGKDLILKIEPIADDLRTVPLASQRQLTTPGPLITKAGGLTETGYSSKPLKEFLSTKALKGLTSKTLQNLITVPQQLTYKQIESYTITTKTHILLLNIINFAHNSEINVILFNSETNESLTHELRLESPDEVKIDAEGSLEFNSRFHFVNQDEFQTRILCNDSKKTKNLFIREIQITFEKLSLQAEFRIEFDKTKDGFHLVQGIDTDRDFWSYRNSYYNLPVTGKIFLDGSAIPLDSTNHASAAYQLQRSKIFSPITHKSEVAMEKQRTPVLLPDHSSRRAASSPTDFIRVRPG